MHKPAVRSPRSIAEEKNGPDQFQGDAGYDAVAGAPQGIAPQSTDRGEARYRSNPTNPPEPAAPFASRG